MLQPCSKWACRQLAHRSLVSNSSVHIRAGIQRTSCHPHEATLSAGLLASLPPPNKALYRVFADGDLSSTSHRATQIVNGSLNPWPLGEEVTGLPYSRTLEKVCSLDHRNA